MPHLVQDVHTGHQNWAHDYFKIVSIYIRKMFKPGYDQGQKHDVGGAVHIFDVCMRII